MSFKNITLLTFLLLVLGLGALQLLPLKSAEVESAAISSAQPTASSSASVRDFSEINGFPIYPQAKFIKKQKQPLCSGLESGFSTCGTTTYTWETSDNFDQVSSWYREDKANSGWKCSGGAGAYGGPSDAFGETSCQRSSLTYDLLISTDSNKSEIVLQIPYNKRAEVTWLIYNHPDYSFEYPSNWTIQRMEYLNLTQISNQNQTVSLIISEGQYPYGFAGDINSSESYLSVTVADVNYATREIVFENDSAYVDFLVTQSPKKHHILFGTGYPVGVSSQASLEDYYKSKETILKILASLEFK
jgi:hypothetical protein